jgi:uncharacterized protein YbjT (DUF2867 family)
MFAVMGATGKVGGEVARQLLNRNLTVRAVVRDRAKGAAWADLGCELAVADIGDADALTAAFTGTTAVFILVPPSFDPAPDFPEAHSTAAILSAALKRSSPERVVYLSTVGAQAAQTNLLTQHTIIEGTLRELATPTTFLRPAWFMENAAWDVAPARETGVIPSFLQPLDRRIPMVATADIGQTAAELMMEPVTGHRTVELQGPAKVSPNDIAESFSALLGKAVRTAEVPRSQWESLFRAQGMKNPLPRIQMLDGFNEGWITFEGRPEDVRKGSVGLDLVLSAMLR